MGFEKIDKTEELMRKAKRDVVAEPFEQENNAAQTPLSNAENEDFTRELSGEAQGRGFSETDSESLTGGLSGNGNSFEDKAVLSESAATNQFAEEDATQSYEDRIYVQNDENKILQFKTLIQQLETVPVNTPEYFRIMSELEKEKFGVMTENELKNYITAKLWSAYNTNDTLSLENILQTFLNFKSEESEKKYGIKGVKNFIQTNTNFSKLINYINKSIREQETNISKTELLWVIINGIANAFEKLIQTKTDFSQNLNDAEKVVMLNSASNKVVKGAIAAFCGIDTDSVIQTEEQEESVQKTVNPENYTNKILTDEEIENYRAEFKNITTKEFRLKISFADSLQKLKVINELIELSDYTKAEKQMLYRECIKQQGIIQAYMPVSESVREDIPVTADKATKQDVEADRVKSLLAYNMYNQCKNPAQKEFTKIILSDSRIYLANKESQEIFTEILKQCNNKSDLEIKRLFLEKILQNPKFLNTEGVLNDSVMYCLKNVNSNNIQKAAELFDEYKNSNSEISGEVFIQIINRLSENLAVLDKISFSEIEQNPDSFITTSYEIRGKNQAEPEQLIMLEGTVTSDYPLLVRDIIGKVKNSKQEELAAFCTEVLSDEELANDETSLKIVSRIVSDNNTYAKDNGSYEGVYNVLKIGYQRKDSERDISEAVQNLQNADYSKYLDNFIQNGYKAKPSNDLTTLAVYSVLEKRTQLLENFTTGRSYTNELLYDLFKVSQKTYCIDILSDLSKRKEFSAKDIIKVANLTTKNTIEITQNVLSKSDLTSKEKVEVLQSIQTNSEQMELIKVILSKDELNLNSLPKILKSIKILQEHDACDSISRLNLKRLDVYTDLLQNPKTENWVMRLLNMGFDIETISNMNPNSYKDINGTIKHTTDNNIKFFIDMGLNEQEAVAVLKAISKNNDNIDTDLKQAAVDMIKSGVPHENIIKILNSANISGIFNPQIAADTLSVENIGLNPFAEKFIPIINNLSPEEIFTKFSPYMISQLELMTAQLSQDCVQKLLSAGIDINNIKSKLDKKNNSQHVDESAADWEFRGISEINGLEKAVIEKYNPEETLYQSKSDLKDWAEDKYLSIKQKALKTKSSQREEKVRKERLKSWFEYIETSPDIKDRTYARVLLAEFVTKDCLSVGSKLPPKFDSSLAQSVISDALKRKDKEQDADRKPEINPDKNISQNNNQDKQLKKKHGYFV